MSQSEKYQAQRLMAYEHQQNGLALLKDIDMSSEPLMLISKALVALAYFEGAKALSVHRCPDPNSPPSTRSALV